MISEIIKNIPKKFRSVISLITLLLILPIMLFTGNQIVNIVSKAGVSKADLVIDAGSNLGEYKLNWLNFAQGGEEPPPMLSVTVDKMKLLKPKLIRIDHIYDYYGVVKGDGKTYDFSKLDATVDDILRMGAVPFFSLSYMPVVFTKNGSIIEAPTDWTDWQELVRRTIEHYSGKANKNIDGVYYEVWNEPNLPQFGAFGLLGSKNYNQLYYSAAKGAEQASNVNRFYLGGPAVGSFYKAWVSDFLTFVEGNNLRLDFYSWHRYHSNPDRFREDALSIRKIVSGYQRFADLPLILSEWGIDSEKNESSNSYRAAAFTLSTIFKTEDVISQSIAFEVKNGPPPTGGQWGLLTHEKDSPPLFLKPRFKAFAATTLLEGTKLSVSGWGSFVQAAAAKKADSTINILVVNYDSQENNWQNVPLTINGLTPGYYKIINHNISAESESVNELTSSNGQLKRELLMTPNTMMLLEVKKTGNLAEYIKGPGGVNDRALALSDSNDLKITPLAVDFSDPTEISFDIKPLWGQDSRQERDILTVGFIDNEEKLISLLLQKVTSRDISFLLLTVSSEQGAERLSMPISGWNKDVWHRIKIGTAGDSFSLTIDGESQIKESLQFQEAAKITGLTFRPFDGAIDNLQISSGGSTAFERNFD